MEVAYKLAEIFNSFQGEFPFIGTYSTFIRFYKCNLDCEFCDTMYTPHEIKYDEVTYSKIKDSVSKTNSIVFTGGEPLLFVEDIVNISTQLLEDNVYIHQISTETNGVLLKKVKDIVDGLIPYFKSNIYNRFSVVWSPKFLTDKLTANMYTSLYEYYDPSYMYIKIVTLPDWKDIIIDFINKVLELHGLKVKKNISLMFLTDNERKYNSESIDLAFSIARKFGLNVNNRLHMELDIA